MRETAMLINVMKNFSVMHQLTESVISDQILK